MKPWIARIMKAQLKQLGKLARDMSADIDKIPDEQINAIGYETPEKIMALNKSLTYLKGKINVADNTDKPTP